MIDYLLTYWQYSLTTLSALGPLLVVLARWRLLSRWVQRLGWLLLVYFLLDVGTYLSAWYWHTNLSLHYLMSLVEVAGVMLIFGGLLRHRWWLRVSAWMALVLGAFTLLEVWIWQDPQAFNPSSRLVGCAMGLVWLAVYLVAYLRRATATSLWLWVALLAGAYFFTELLIHYFHLWVMGPSPEMVQAAHLTGEYSKLAFNLLLTLVLWKWTPISPDFLPTNSK